MNSRERRKLAAIEHNERISLIAKLEILQASIRKKHGVSVMAIVDKTNESVLKEIERLSAILECETPPKSRRVAAFSPLIHAIAVLGAESSRVISGVCK